MAKAVVTIKIMPESPDVDFDVVKTQATEKIDAFVGEEGEKRFELEPIAFGLKALKIIFVMDEKIGSTDPLEQDLSSIEGVNSVDVIDVRRAIG
jgi:elongation factor 1-beta